MRFVILAQAKQSYTTRRLLEAARKAGHRVDVRAPHRFRLGFGEVAKVDDGSERRRDLVLSRFGASQQTYGVAVLSQFEAAGVPAFNPASAVALVRNRVRCTQRLDSYGLPVPRAMLVHRPEDVEHAIASVGGLPVMLRRVSGQPTFAALFCETKQGCLAALEAMWGLGHEVLVSQHFSEALDAGLRCLVVEGEVIAAVRRKGRTVRTRFRFERRGKAVEIVPSRALKSLMRGVFEATGLRMAGVDVLETSDGYRILDVNAAPGIEQLELTTGRDLAKLTIDAASRFAQAQRRLKRSAQ